MSRRGLKTAKGAYSTIQAMGARPAIQPAAHLLRSVAQAAMNYQPGHVTTSGEQAALAEIRRQSGDARIIFDIGANIGVWSALAHEAFPTATIHAFEPDPKTCEELQVNTSSSVITHCAAMSDDVGVKTLHSVPEMSWLSSLDVQDLSRMHVTQTESRQVQCTTVDEFCAAEGIDTVDLLKIDVEGHELSVLRGAHSMLSNGRVAFVQFEMSPAWIETRTFLRDILGALGPHCQTYRILRTGLEKVNYSYKDEIFEPANYLAKYDRTRSAI
jgi:FkbM family methyltransferase